jgi:Transglutaminase-like superfamily
MLRQLDIPTARAALWTWQSLRNARRRLQNQRLEDIRLPPPPALPTHAVRGVAAVLDRTSNTCLERSLVVQRWLAAHGEAPDVLVGVVGPASRFKAHAWIDGEQEGDGFEVLMRVPWVEADG